ncbi:MAG: hypothetical protein ACJ71O_06910 [Nitrososphaeraceae archaeon]
MTIIGLLMSIWIARYFDSKPPKGRSNAYDEGYSRGWFEEHFSPNPAAAASSSSSAVADRGSAASSSSSAST